MRKEITGFGDSSGISWTICKQCYQSINFLGNKGPKATYKSQNTIYNNYSPRQCIQYIKKSCVCTSLQTVNQTNTSSLNFYRPRVLPDAQPTVSEHTCIIFTARCYASAILAMALCLSVTSRCSTKTAKRRITQTTPHDSPGTLVS